MLANQIEHLAILDLRIESLKARIAERRGSAQPLGDLEQTLATLLESRRVYTKALIEADTSPRRE